MSCALILVIRNMATCRDPGVYQRLESGGLAGTAVQLAGEALGNISPANVEYAEEILAVLNSLWYV